MITRILLDTGAIRNFVHPIGPKLEIATLKTRLWKYRISLADGTFAEILRQLMDSRIDFGEWRSRIDDLDQLLDPRWPIFPGGRERSAIMGLQRDLMFSQGESQIYHKSVWNLLRQSSSLGQLTSNFDYQDSAGIPKRLKADAVRTRTILEIEDTQAALQTGILVDRRSRQPLESAPTGYPNLPDGKVKSCLEEAWHRLDEVRNEFAKAQLRKLPSGEPVVVQHSHILEIRDFELVSTLNSLRAEAAAAVNCARQALGLKPMRQHKSS
jgi:hypothetical protein